MVEDPVASIGVSLEIETSFANDSLRRASEPFGPLTNAENHPIELAQDSILGR